MTDQTISESTKAHLYLALVCISIPRKLELYTTTDKCRIAGEFLVQIGTLVPAA